MNHTTTCFIGYFAHDTLPSKQVFRADASHAAAENTALPHSESEAKDSEPLRLASRGSLSVTFPSHEPDEESFISYYLTKGYWVVIDKADIDKFIAYKWCATVAQSGHVYAVTSCNNKLLYLHRHLLDAPKGTRVDHRDGDTLNCRRSNLRLATKEQNNQNRAPKQGLAYKGITRRGNRWKARIKGVVIGWFATPEDAALAYNFAAVEQFGEFARLNVVAPVGLEPTQADLEGQCSIHLSYGATTNQNNAHGGAA